MYLFTRNTRLIGGNGTAGIDWAISVTGKVKEVTGQQVDLWAAVFSAGVGSITWTSVFEDLLALETMGDKLQADPGFGELANSGAKFTNGTLDDAILQPIFGMPETEREINYVSTVGAVAASGSVERAIAVGIEIAEKAAKISGVTTTFATAVTGAYGGVAWITGYDSITSLEKAQSALSADASFLKLIDSAKGVYVEDPALTQNAIYRKIV